MLAVDDSTSETEKQLFGTLAYRMISKAAADVPVHPVSYLHLVGILPISPLLAMFLDD